MASPCEVLAWAENESQAQRWFAIAQAEVLRIEAKYSRYLETSVTSGINRAAATGSGYAVDVETQALVDFGVQLFQASAGAFDLTSGVLRNVWNFKAANPCPPTDRAIDAMRRHIGWAQVQWRAGHIQLQPGMEIDFGAIGKEYAADRAASLCAEAGAQALLVNLGGDIRALGAQPGEQPWRVGIVHPRSAEATLATLELTQGAVATSGDYERFFIYAGTRFHHILDARTGRPTPACPQSVSVIAPACLAAGGMATLCMLMSDDVADDWLANAGLSSLLVRADGGISRR